MRRKDAIRRDVFGKLRAVALPDSRFGYDFDNFIPDFAMSPQALERLLNLKLYARLKLIFTTPDNSLEGFRLRALRDGIRQVISTYGIRRGMILLEPIGEVKHQEAFAATLDGMERLAQQGVVRYLALREVQRLGQFDLLVTGASAVCTNGVRVGKGHGYFDLEWAMLRMLGVIHEDTPVIAVVHDVQVVDEDLAPEPIDTIVDIIVTPTRTIQVSRRYPRPERIYWDKLEPGMLDAIPYLTDLKQFVAKEVVR